MVEPSRYLMLQSALARFGRDLAALQPDEVDEVRGLAVRTERLQQSLLAAAPRPPRVVPERLEAALQALRQRYPDEAAWQAVLRRNRIGPDELRAAVRRQLGVEAVLEQVAATAPPVSDDAVAAFYRRNRERFRQPERRDVRHLLITVNPEFPENRHAAVRAQITAIAARLRSRPERFAREAARHSECPSALQEGRLGWVRPGQLFPALDEALFAAPAGELVGPVETGVGLHLLRCEAVEPAREGSLAQAAPGIRAHLQERRRERARRAWLAHLTGRPADDDRSSGIKF